MTESGKGYIEKKRNRNEALNTTRHISAVQTGAVAFYGKTDKPPALKIKNPEPHWLRIPEMSAHQ